MMQNPALNVEPNNTDVQLSISLVGRDGRTPVKGKDYWTAADKQEIINDVTQQIGGTQGNPNSVLYVKQDLTREQKEQARFNLDVMSIDDIHATNDSMRQELNERIDNIALPSPTASDLGKVLVVTTTGENEDGEYVYGLELGKAPVDSSLTMNGIAADAAVVGEKIAKLDGDMIKSVNGKSPDENGNIALTAENVNAYTKGEITSIVRHIDDEIDKHAMPTPSAEDSGMIPIVSLISEDEDGVPTYGYTLTDLPSCETDNTLSVEGVPADAAAVGTRITQITEEIGDKTAVYDTELDMRPKPSKNLNATPYDAGHTENGITFTTNADNSVSISGKPTGTVYWPAVATATEKRWQLPAGTYTLSGAPGPLTGITLLTYASQTSTTATGDYGQGGNDGAPVQVNIPNDCWAIIRIVVMNNWAGGDVTLYPQLEAGEVATKYASPWAGGYYSKRFADIETAVDELDAIVNDHTAPDYYFSDDYLTNKVARINELARSVGADGDAFVFISDTHWEKNAGKSPALLRYLRENTHIDRLFGGGDYQDNALSIVPPLFECVDALRDTWTGKRYLTLGNHDYMGSEAYALKDKDLYYAINSYGTERIGNLNRNYYYVDNPQVKLRYIVLNRYIDRVPVTNEINGLNEEQRTWLQNDALKVEDGWGVLVFVHDLYRFIYGEDGYTATVSLNYPDSRATVELLDAFVDDGGTVVGIFCGENHVDMVNRTPGGIPVITTTCDKNKSGGEGVPISDQWAERLDGTIHEQAFDVMIVDKANHTIHAVRIGYPARDSVEGAWGEKVEERTITY